MNNWLAILIGAILFIFVSFYATVVVPSVQLTQTKPLSLGAGETYPSPRPGSALLGMDNYRSLGCYYCHTRMVKPYEFGSDYERGWGNRRSVARDYIGETSLLCGSIRLGADLMNIGSRNPEKYAVRWNFSTTNRTTQLIEKRARNLLILYNPRYLNPDSIMPSYNYLFDEENAAKNGTQTSIDGMFIFESKRVIPKNEAKHLADFLESMNFDQPLFEAPSPLAPSQIINKPTALTNVFRTETGN
ncbi:MAG: cbb3-type cytochrome c oxidase subunit II [Verrucomicrobiia bacterium]